MILIDSSIWIGYIQNHETIPHNPEFFRRVVTCGPVLQEVLQGLRPGLQSTQLTEALLALPRLADPVPLPTYLAAADLFRQGRARGITIRSSTDCLIAAIAIEHDATVWHRDRDFDAIASFTRLRASSRNTS